MLRDHPFIRFNTNLKTVSIEVTKQIKKRQKDSFQPPLQIHHQEGHNDRSLAGLTQFRHDPSETVTPFSLTKLPFNDDSVNLILTGYFFKGIDFIPALFCLFR